MKPSPKNLFRGRTLAIAAAALTVWLGALALAVLFSGGAEPAAPAREPARAAPAADQAHEPETPESHDHGPRPREDEVVYGYDVYDERLVVGLSENVFLGAVQSEAGHESIPTSIPGREGPAQTQFSVEVLRPVEAGGPEPLSTGDEVLVS